MTIVVDAAPIVALADRRDPQNAEVKRFLEETGELLLMSQLVAAEIDYLLAARFGWRASRVFLEDVTNGRYRLECLDADDFPTLIALTDRYADLAPGLADLSIVILAHRFNTRRILTFDQRHFRVMTPLTGGAFELLPMDAPPADV